MEQKMNLFRSPALVFLSLVCLLCCDPFGNTPAQISQNVEIPSSPNPVGSGARALGMGGAFIAVADDATAASWNPGGLIQLELPEVSVVGAVFHRIEDNSFGKYPESSGKETVDQSTINYFSAAYPFKAWGYNMIVSMNYQNLYDFTREWDFIRSFSDNMLSSRENQAYDLAGSLNALGVAYCFQITPQVSIGFTLNFWDDGLFGNEWKEKTTLNGSGNLAGLPVNYKETSTDKYEFDGFNANLGIMWSVTGKLTLGAVFKTPFEADLRHRHSSSSIITFPNAPESNQSFSNSFTEDETLDMPMSFGIGIAYRFSDALTASLDINRTEWDDFELKDSEDNKISPITGRLTSESDVDETHQIRMGAEYIFIESKYAIPLRCGLFYDPAPSSENPDDFYGVTFGSGIVIGRYIFDMAYQYRFGNDVGGHIWETADLSQDVDEHTAYASLIVHF